MNIGNFLFLLRYSVAKPGTIGKYRKALKNQYLSEESLSALAWKKTQTLIQESYTNVPWYNQKFKEVGITPNDIKNPADFTKLPVLSRNDLVENYSEFISKKANAEHLKISTTGGSTGTPVKIGMKRNAVRELQKWQLFSWWGISLIANMASIYRGLPVTGLRKIVTDLINFPQKVIRLDATNITKENIENFIHEVRQIKPELIHGYVGAVDAIADYILDNRIQLPATKAVWLTAAPVTKVQEVKISEAFQAPVCDQYGCSEIYFVAAECPHKRGLHIFSDSVKVEILDENNQPVPTGTYGKIVLTNLDEFHFPLIRYENGDIGRILDTACTCGMTLPLLDKVKGRISQQIKMQDGLVLSGEYLTCLFDDYTDQVKQFQIIQRKDTSIDINILFHTNCRDRDLVKNHAYNELFERIKDENLIRINEVHEIINTRGKLNFIISEL
jgi:phenylacetate-CoA ligase